MGLRAGYPPRTETKHSSICVSNIFVFFAMPKDRYVNATHSLVKFIGFDKFWCQNRLCTYDSDTNTPPNIKLDERVRVVSA